MQINPKVVDISHYDDVETIGKTWTGFQKLRNAGYVGVINKATQGRGMVDASYDRRRIPCIASGLRWGAYHYLTGEDATQQAAHFLNTADIDTTTLVALDHETPGVSLELVREFMEAVYSQIGRYPWLYSGFLIKEQIGDEVDPFWSNIKLWLSHYSINPTWPRCWAKPTLWQFTGDGVGPPPHVAPGISIAGGCDINSFDGTDEELSHIWAT